MVCNSLEGEVSNSPACLGSPIGLFVLGLVNGSGRADSGRVGGGQLVLDPHL